MPSFRDICENGLWKNNPALVQVLGLCPLLAISNTAINGLGLGLATLLVLTASNVAVSLIRRWVADEIRIPAYIMLIAALVTCIDLLMNAYWHGLYTVLGIFIPLIVTNCIVMGRALSFAARETVARAALDGVMNGLGFLTVLVLLGAGRELFGHGTLFSGAAQLFGAGGEALSRQIFALDNVFLLATLPPGAFIGLGLMIAAKNAVDARRKKSDTMVRTAIKAVSIDPGVTS